MSMRRLDVRADGQLTLESPLLSAVSSTKLLLTCGSSYIQIKPDEIVIKSPSVRINAPADQAYLSTEAVITPVQPPRGPEVYEGQVEIAQEISGATPRSESPGDGAGGGAGGGDP